ncbi:DNA damage-binding protein 1 [Coemansia sp. RSA 2320]|nr:DNA damage-binding protein 1 [Coemansia sp. RSA 2320]
MTRQVRVYTVGAGAGELRPSAVWTSEPVEPTARLLVALPRGAVLVVGDAAVAVAAAGRAPVALAKRAAVPAAATWVDGACERLLLGDDDGELSLVVLRYDASRHVRELVVERLGAVPAPAALAMLRGGAVFVGSRCGDHAVVRLHAESRQAAEPPIDAALALGPIVRAAAGASAPPSSFVEPLAAPELFASLAPVVDVCAVGGGSGSGGCVVTCSGQRSTPVLRLVRNGVGVEGAAAAAVRGAVRAWTLPSQTGGSALAVLSLVGATRVLGWAARGGSVELAELAQPGGWRLGEPTLAAAMARDGRHAVHVTPAGVLLLDAADAWRACAAWAPAGRISAAAAAGDQIVVASDGGAVALVEVRGAALALVAQRRVDHAVSCVALATWPGAAHVALGLWGANDVCVLALPDLAPATPSVPLLRPGSALPRSVLLCALGGAPYLLVGAGDGVLHQIALSRDPDHHGLLRAGEYKTVQLGSRPLELALFANHGAPSVFVAGDHPAVLFASGGTPPPSSAGVPAKLMCANVDAQGAIRCVAPLNLSCFPDALLLLSDDRMWIGRPDPSQRLHIRTRPLPPFAAPHRIVYNAAAAVFGVATIHAIPSGDLVDMEAWQDLALGDSPAQQQFQTFPVEAARFSVFGGGSVQPMDIKDSILLMPFEMPESLCVVTLACLPRPPAERDEPAATESVLQDQQPPSPTSAAATALSDVFLLGTSVVLPGEDDAKRGRVLALQWDKSTQKICHAGSFAALGAVYALVPFRSMLLAAIGSRLLLLGWQHRSQSQIEQRGEGLLGDYELVVLCSQQTQIAALSLAVNGDYIIVGDLMASVSVYRYEESNVPMLPPSLPAPATAPGEASRAAPGEVRTRRRWQLVPVARDYDGVWTTCVAAVPPPLAQNVDRLYPTPIEAEMTFTAAGVAAPDYAMAFRDALCERFMVADAYCNIFRVAHSSNGIPQAAGMVAEQRLFVEARWHLGDMINVIRAGSLVMDVADPEFPDTFRASLIYGTVQGAVGVIASVEDGRVGRILDRLQVNMAQLLPTPGLWDYDTWRAYSSDQRTSRAFGVLDGDLIERFLELSPEMQRLVVTGGGALIDADELEAAERRCKAEYWASHSRIESEGEVAVLAQMSVSDITQREDDVSVEYIVRLVESLSRLH